MTGQPIKYDELIEFVRECTQKGMEYTDIVRELNWDAQYFDNQWTAAKNRHMAERTIIKIEGENITLYDWVCGLPSKEREKLFGRSIWLSVGARKVKALGIEIVSTTRVEFPKMICDTLYAKNLHLGFSRKTKKCRRG